MDLKTLKFFELLFILLTSYALEIREIAQMKGFHGSYLFDKIEAISRIHRCREDGIIIIALAFLFHETKIVILFFMLGIIVILASPEQPALEHYLWPIRIITNKIVLFFIAAFSSTFDPFLNGFIPDSWINLEYLRYTYASIIILLLFYHIYIGWCRHRLKRR